MFIFCNYIILYLLLCSNSWRCCRWQEQWESLPLCHTQAHFYFNFFANFFQKFGGFRGGKATPLSPATCVFFFFSSWVECCCLLALQERERVKKKKYRGGVYPSYVHYFSATYVLYARKRGKKTQRWKRKSSSCK